MNKNVKNVARKYQSQGGFIQNFCINKFGVMVDRKYYQCIPIKEIAVQISKRRCTLGSYKGEVARSHPLFSIRKQYFFTLKTLAPKFGVMPLCYRSLLAKTMAKFLHEYTYKFGGLFSIKNKRATCWTARYFCR
jgi:hypothetical protein